MTPVRSPLFDPDRLSRRLMAGNRWRRFLAQPGEDLLALAAGLALSGLMLAMALPALTALVNLPFGEWHGWTLLLVVGTTLTIATWHQARRHALRLTCGWLGTTPWSPTDRRISLHRRLLGWLTLRLLALLVLEIGLLTLRQSPWPGSFVWLLALPPALAPLLAWTCARVAWRHSGSEPRRLGERLNRAGNALQGLDLLQAGWTPAPPRSWKLVTVLALLALPADLGFGGGALALLLVAALLWLGRGFARYRRIATAASSWLATQPLLASALLRALALPLMRQQLLAVLVLALAARGAGVPTLLLVLAVSGWVLASVLLVLLAFATRRAPHRYTLAAMPQLLALVLLLQALPPLVPLLWLILVVRAWHQARLHQTV